MRNAKEGGSTLAIAEVIRDPHIDLVANIHQQQRLLETYYPTSTPTIETDESSDEAKLYYTINEGRDAFVDGVVTILIGGTEGGVDLGAIDERSLIPKLHCRTNITTFAKITR